MRNRNEILEALADVYRRQTSDTSLNYEANRKYVTDRLILELLCDIRDSLETPDIRIVTKPTISIKVNKITPR